MLFTILITKLYAVPAYPFPIKYTQPDGSEITIQLKGDERVHWAETSDGYTLLSNGKNGWEYAVADSNGDLKTSGILAREVGKRTLTELKLLKGVSKNNRFSTKQVKTLKSVWEAKFGSEKLVGVSDFFRPNVVNATTNDGRKKVFSPNGTKKLIMILIQYTDKKFTKTQQNFVDLMNTQNYNQNGAEGSVQQYFYEMSYGQFKIVTDVAPKIYTADHDMAYYGAHNGTANDIRANDLMKEAIQKADPDVDYTQYDNDGDGSIDGIYIIYAGYGEASSGIDETIWPHAGGVSGTYDGKTASKYSCSNELNYNGASTPGTLTTIGVICHEFGHVCGAPDYYDTDYATGGSFTATGQWDLMDRGCYNGAISGSKPAHFNPFEKTRAGWLTPVTLTSPTSIIDIPDITTNSIVYKYNTTTENEYYLIENRQKTGFNAYCPGHGLMIYHYNKAVWDVSANKTSPQGFYPVCASATISPGISSPDADYGSINSDGCPFPGSTNKSSFTDATTPTAKSWNGSNTYKPITNITENNTTKKVSFTFMGGNSCTPPTVQASNLSFSSIQDNQLTLNWTRGNGTGGVIVLARRNSAVNTTPLNGTSFTANSAFQQGNLVDPDTYVIYKGTGTNVTFTDLLKASTYYFAVFEYNSDLCYTSTALTGNASTTGCTYGSATAPQNTLNYVGITNVNLNTIDNKSQWGSTAYTDYSHIITNLVSNNSYNLKIATHSYTNTVNTKAWIDWNNDCLFTSSELYDFGSSTNDAVLTKQILVPANAYSGYVRMRVRTGINSPMNATGETSYSEAEDYTLKIIGGCTPPTTQASGFSATNIQDEQMTINWTRGNGNKVIVIAKLGSETESPIGADLTANAELGSGTQIGIGNYVVYNGTGNNVTVTGLVKGATYYYAIYEITTPTNCILQPALTGSASTSGCRAGIPTDSKNYSRGITNVTFNTINNTSKREQAYSDYRYINTSVFKGETYNLSVTVLSGTNKYLTKAWIDWNKDCIFDPLTEEYDLGTNTTTGLTSLSPLSIIVPLSAKDGPTVMRIRTRYWNAPTPLNNNDDSEAEDYILRVDSHTTTWNGTTWNPSYPTSLYNAIIDGNYNDAGFACNNLTINAGKQMTVASGTLAVEGNLTIKSDVTGTATLIDNGTVTVTGTSNVEQYLSSSRNWYMSSPVTGATIPIGNTYYKYVEAGNNGSTWASVAPGSQFDLMTGYIVKPASEITFVFSGALNTGTKSRTDLTSTATAKAGFNLVGNPYPSYVSWDAATKANLGSTIWYRTQTGGVYEFHTYNSSGAIGVPTGTTGIIAPMQSFWVRANAGTTGRLEFTNAMRSHQNANSNLFKSPVAVTQKVLRLQVSNGTNTDETVVYFNPYASNDFDIYDSEKMSNGNNAIPEIFTQAGTEEVVINGLKSVETKNIVPLGFRTGAANTFTIKVTEISNFDADTKIILMDNTVEHDITDGNLYSFTSDVASTNNRFTVIFKSNSNITGLNNLTDKQSISVFRNANNHIVVMRDIFTQTGIITVCNALGQKILSTTITGASTEINKTFNPGIYFVTVNELRKNATIKTIIK